MAPGCPGAVGPVEAGMTLGLAPAGATLAGEVGAGVSTTSLTTAGLGAGEEEEVDALAGPPGDGAALVALVSGSAFSFVFARL